MSFRGNHGLKVTMPAADALPAANPLDDQHMLDKKGTLTIGSSVHVVFADDLKEKRLLGRGQYGAVYEMHHPPSNTTLAVKRIRLTDDLKDRRRLWMDHDTCMRSTACPHIVNFYGSFFREGDVWICMEKMDWSLDKLYKALHARGLPLMPEVLVGRINYSVVMALAYLKDEHGIIHRDVKPSNILMDMHGEVKLCDFGISGKLVDSVVKSKDAGCKPYMAPERVRIQAAADEVGYDIRSDVWSLGISLVELAIGKFPYDQKANLVFALIKQVVDDPAPTLPKDLGFSAEFHDYVHACLQKDPANRPKYESIKVMPFFKKHESTDFDVSAYLKDVVDRTGGAAKGSSDGMVASPRASS